MQLVEIFLPTKLPSGRPASELFWTSVRDVLVNRFGGLTARDAKPAKGLWQDQYDDVLVIEIMCENLDIHWWRQFRARMEQEFEQEEILIRATSVMKL